MIGRFLAYGLGMVTSSPAAATLAMRGFTRPIKFTLQVSLDGFDILFYDCKAISKEIALHNFAPIAIRLWQKDQDATNFMPNVKVIRNGKII